MDSQILSKCETLIPSTFSHEWSPLKLQLKYLTSETNNQSRKYNKSFIYEKCSLFLNTNNILIAQKLMFEYGIFTSNNISKLTIKEKTKLLESFRNLFKLDQVKKIEQLLN